MKVSDTKVNARSGLTFTALSFGGAPIGNFNGAFTEDEAQQMVSQAWDQGIRYFDTAPGYGNGLSEHRLGLALRQRDRKDYVLSTKVGRVLTPRLDAPSTNGQYLDIPPLVARCFLKCDRPTMPRMIARMPKTTPPMIVHTVSRARMPRISAAIPAPFLGELDG